MVERPDCERTDEARKGVLDDIARRARKDRRREWRQRWGPTLVGVTATLLGTPLVTALGFWLTSR